MKKQRKHYTSEEKVAILRRHLLEKEPISKLCDELGLQPTVFYRWQKEFFENGAVAFEQKARPNHSAEQERIVYLEKKIQTKDEVLAELMAEHVALKKSMVRRVRPSGQLVRHRDNRNIAVHPIFQLIHPRVQCQSVSMGLGENGSRAMDEQTPEIRIAAFADPEQLRLSSGRVLPWDQAQPGRELMPLDERRSVSDRSHLSRSPPAGPLRGSVAIFGSLTILQRVIADGNDLSRQSPKSGTDWFCST